MEYIEFGEDLPAEEASAAPSETAQAVLIACRSNRAFTFVERRIWESKDVGACDVLVVDCVNDQVPTRNAKVMVRERLALVLPRDPSQAPQVRALRKSFPTVMHLNHVPQGEPASLCLYFEPWAHVRRTWTAERFLQRVLVWLTGTSRGTLHRAGQPVEAMYFESPIEVVLPPEWEDRLNIPDHVLVLAQVQQDEKRCTFRSLVVPRAAADRHAVKQTVAISVAVDAVVHGNMESFPATLGELSDRLVARGSALYEPLRAEIVRLVGSSGVSHVPGQACLLLVSVPTKRHEGGNIERVDVRAFKLPCELWKLGVDIGAIHKGASPERYYAVPIIGGGAELAPAAGWQSIPALPVAVRNSVTKRFARGASAVPEESADHKRILAGVGALGSALADLWSREGWAQWTLVDPDHVEPHNIVRHLAKDYHIGLYKADAVKNAIDSNYPPEGKTATAIRASILTTTDTTLTEELRNASLVVDATTTLEVPRELSRREDVPRCVSVFLTPSGKASVMLLEGGHREVRLDELEAQYYSAILSSAWGNDHLAGHKGEFWVGAGCRDISLILSNELVQLHASILARQVRLLSAVDPARIRVWLADDETSEVRSVDVPVQSPIRKACGAWTIVTHEGVSEKLKRLRTAHLPVETGGVIVGYVDHPLRRVFVVDVLPAPIDSEESATGFVRGIDGLAEALQRIRYQTAGIVDYIGEWHSHPPFSPAIPSGEDVSLLAHCTRTLSVDGVPALMIIVGAAGEISCSLGGCVET
ncbi:Hypothetical protein A7982_00484 [Minicystis rosea]|nr:Hypothetical protein A7982_00484 [Minicystis rosea]